MSDAPAEPTQAVIIRPPREIRVTEDQVAIFDTAKFEHFGRVASVIAEAGMMPETLRGWYEGRGDDKKFYEHEPMVQKARAFMIVELADRLSFSPFGLMGACSFVHGRLMLEGKVVHAAIQRKLGVDLDYLFGAWDAKAERTVLKWTKDEEGRPVVDPTGEGQGDALGVVVRGILPSGEVREVHGSVGIWKTTGSGSPWRAGAMKRQCRYRGSREWERAFSPGLTLGVTFDDEWEGDLIEVQPQRSRGRAKADLAGKLSAPTDDNRDGFSAAHVHAETAKPDHDAETGEVIEPEDPTETAGAQDAGTGQGSSGSATDASGASAAATSSRAQRDAPSTAGARTGDLLGDDDLPERLRARQAQAKAEAPAAGDEVDAFEATLPDQASWAEIKAGLVRTIQTDAWNERDADDQALVRSKTWAAAHALIGAGKDKVDPALDATAFRCWIEWCDDPDAIDGTLAALGQSEAFAKALNDAQRASVTKAAQTRAAKLREA